MRRALAWCLSMATVLVGCGPSGGARVEPSADQRPSVPQSAPPPKTEGPVCSSPRLSDPAALAIVDDQSLYLLDPATCERKVLVGGSVSGPVQFSPSGRWVATRNGVVVQVDGTRVARPLGSALAVADGAWAWDPTSDRLVGATQGGGLLEGRPGQRPRRRLPEGWGAQGVSFLPTGERVLVVRQAANVSVWILPGSSPNPRRVYRLPGKHQVRAPPVVSEDGRWALVTHGRAGADQESLTIISPSGDRPSQTLERTHPAGAAAIVCGSRAVWVADRTEDASNSVRTAAAPNWRVRTLVSEEIQAGFLACTPDATGVAVAYRRPTDAIELVRFDGANSETISTWPGPDGLRQARWSPDGELLAFVAGGPLALAGLSADPTTGVIFITGSQQGRVPRPLTEVDLGLEGATFDWRSSR